MELVYSFIDCWLIHLVSESAYTEHFTIAQTSEPAVEKSGMVPILPEIPFEQTKISNIYH